VGIELVGGRKGGEGYVGGGGRGREGGGRGGGVSGGGVVKVRER